MSLHSSWSWDEMVTAFRTLGGTVDNIRLGNGPRGPGLFAVDNARPILLRVPENLLFRTADIEFAGARIRLKDSASAGKAEREFFENYEEGFSWGAGGRETWTAFETGLDELPGEIRTLLATEFAMAKRFEGDAFERAGRQFLDTREIGWKDRSVLVPLLELANNGEQGLEYKIGDDLRLEGTVADEILVPSSVDDPFSLFFNCGRAGPALGAFSLAMKMNVGPNQLTIGRDTGLSTQRGNYLVPELAREGSKISLAHLMLGHAPYSSAPRGIFRALMQEHFGANTDEVFDSVRHFNRSRFLQLLKALERFDGPMIAELGRMARFQLAAISWSTGSADLYAPVPPPWENEALSTTGASAGSSWTWRRMLEAFRELGGEAENIRLAYGSSGRGIFPVRRDRPFRLKVPENLLLPVSDIVFAGGEIGPGAESTIGVPEREFFTRYEEAFSWGGGGQEEAAAFVAGMESLPAEVSEILAAEFGMSDLLEGDPAARVQNRFLRSRMIEWKGRAVLAPLAELVNRRPDGIVFAGDDFLEIQGGGDGEIFALYRSADAFESFRRFGVASPGPGAFCFPMKTKVGPFDLVVQRNIVVRGAHGPGAMPELRRDQDRLILSFLQLGHPASPGVSRGILRALMRSVDITADEADEAFDRILRFNRAKFLGLLEALAPHKGELVVTLRKMARFQLEAMSWCIGARQV